MQDEIVHYAEVNKSLILSKISLPSTIQVEAYSIFAWSYGYSMMHDKSEDKVWLKIVLPVLLVQLFFDSSQ